MTPVAFAVGRSCPKAVCHQRHSDPNNRPLCAPCQLPPGGDEGGGEQWPWGQWGLFRAALLLGRGQPHTALGGDLRLSPAPSCQTNGRFGVPLRRVRARWGVRGLLKGAVNVFVKRRSVNKRRVKSEQPLQRNHLPVPSWGSRGAGGARAVGAGPGCAVDAPRAPMTALAMPPPARALPATARGGGGSFCPGLFLKLVALPRSHRCQGTLPCFVPAGKQFQLCQCMWVVYLLNLDDGIFLPFSPLAFHIHPPLGAFPTQDSVGPCSAKQCRGTGWPEESAPGAAATCFGARMPFP